MKRVLLCALAFHAAAAAVLAQSPPAEPPAPAARAKPVKRERARRIPDEIFAAELKDLFDVSFTLGEYRGRVFVLNFWASWCGPCRAEIPELNKLRDEYAPRGVEFVGLTTENPGTASEKVREFTNEFQMAYRVGWADPDVFAMLVTRAAIPQTLVVAEDGRIVARFIGYSKGVSQQLRAGIEQALKPPPEEAEDEEEAEETEEAEEAAPAQPKPSPQPSPAVPPAAPETSPPPRA